MGKTKIPQGKNSKAPEPAKQENKAEEIQQIQDIRNDFIATFPKENQESGYLIKVYKLTPTIRHTTVWAFRGQITSSEILNQIPEEIIMERFDGGEFKLMGYDLNNKYINATRRIAIGDLFQKNEQLKNTPLPEKKFSPISEEDSVRAKRADLEKKRLEVEEKKLDMQLQNLQPRKDDNGDIKVLASNIDHMGKDLANSFMSGLEKIGSMFTNALAVLKPGDSSLKDEIRALHEKMEKINTDKSQNQLITLMSENFKSIMAMTSQHTEAQRAEAQKNQAMLLELIKENGKTKSGGMEEMMGVMSKAITRLIMPLMELNDSRNPMRDIDAEIIPHEGKSGWDKVLEVVGAAFDKINENGTLEKIFGGKGGVPEGAIVITPEKLEQMKYEVAANVRKEMEARGISAGGTPEPKPAETKITAPVPEPKPVIVTNPQPDEPVFSTDPQQNKKDRVNYILKIIIEEMKTRANTVTWISKAYENLPGDVLDEIREARKNNTDVQAFAKEAIDVISIYADEKLFDQLYSMTLANKLFNLKNIQWLLAGLETLGKVLLEDVIPEVENTNAGKK